MPLTVCPVPPMVLRTLRTARRAPARTVHCGRCCPRKCSAVLVPGNPLPPNRSWLPAGPRTPASRRTAVRRLASRIRLRPASHPALRRPVRHCPGLQCSASPSPRRRLWLYCLGSRRPVLRRRALCHLARRRSASPSPAEHRWGFRCPAARRRLALPSPEGRRWGLRWPVCRRVRHCPALHYPASPNRASHRLEPHRPTIRRPVPHQLQAPHYPAPHHRAPHCLASRHHRAPPRTPASPTRLPAPPHTPAPRPARPATASRRSAAFARPVRPAPAVATTGVPPKGPHVDRSGHSPRRPAAAIRCRTARPAGRPPRAGPSRLSRRVRARPSCPARPARRAGGHRRDRTRPLRQRYRLAAVATGRTSRVAAPCSLDVNGPLAPETGVAHPGCIRVGRASQRGHRPADRDADRATRRSDHRSHAGAQRP